MLGLLLSLFSKPLLLFALPGLLLIPETRRTTAWTLAAYLLVSGACLILPPLNPEAIGLREVVSLALDPAWVREHMNIYRNEFVLNPYMKDNSIHWLNLVAQSGFVLNHVEVFSLAAFLATAAGGTRLAWLPALFLFATLLLSIMVARLHGAVPRLRGAALALLLLGCAFFLSYPTVWEYQYTGALLVAASVLCLGARGSVAPLTARVAAVCALLWFAPSLASLFAEAPDTRAALLWTRGARVVPAVALWLMLAIDTVRVVAADRHLDRELPEVP
jgi:hypothetical protein